MRNCKIMDFAFPDNHRVKLKESEKKDKYLDLTRKLKNKQKLWNMKVTFIPIIIGDLCMVTNRWIRGQEDLEIKGRVENLQNISLLKSARILRRVLETWGDLLSLRLERKTIS